MIYFDNQTNSIIIRQGGFMKTKEIKQLIEILEASKLNELSYKEDGFEISLKKGGDVHVQAPLAQTHVNQEAVPKNQKTIQSPLVGVYYDKPSPDEPSFVKVGDSIKVGDILCIIEAMKVMNEIKSDKAGIVKEILVNDGDAVSYNQDLLVID